MRAKGKGRGAEGGGRRTCTLVCCALLLALCLVGRAEIVDRVLATMPGQVIMQSDVQAALDLGLVDVPVGGDRIAVGLAAVIDRVLMLSEVRRVMPADPSIEAVDARLARIRQRFASPADLSRALAATGIDEALLRVYAADDLRLASYLDERFSAASQPTDEEVKQAGEASRQRLTEERRRSLVAAWAAELRRRADVTIVSP